MAASTTAAVDLSIFPRGEFIAFFLFQCERIKLPNTKRLRPPRSVLQYLAAVEPFLFTYQGETLESSMESRKNPVSLSTAASRLPQLPSPSPQDAADWNSEVAVAVATSSAPSRSLLDSTTSSDPTHHNKDGMVLDLSSLFPGSAVSIALFRALELFIPQQLQQSRRKLILNIATLELTQCGLDNAAITALCDVLRCGRCAKLRHVSLDRNEYVAVEAGQSILRALGAGGPLGDGAKGTSYEQHVGPLPIVPQSQAGGGSAEGAYGGLDASGTITAVSQSLRDALPLLVTISLEGTHCPPHFIRRIDGLLG